MSKQRISLEIVEREFFEKGVNGSFYGNGALIFTKKTTWSVCLAVITSLFMASATQALVTTYYFSDGDINLTGIGTIDELIFADDLGGSFDHKNFGFLQNGDDLIIYPNNGRAITIDDHFLTNIQRYETLYFIDANIDFTNSHIVYEQSGASISLVGDGNTNLMLASNTSRNIYARKGDDTIYAGGGNDIIQGESGNDIIYGGDGHDDIEGGGNDDVIYGDAGDDRITGGTGEDLIYGGDGNDIIVGEENGNLSGADVIYGGNGDDNISARGYTTPIGLTSSVYGGNGNDIISYTGRAYGENGDDRISIISSVDGGSTAYGGDGSDMIWGNNGKDFLYGGSGDDFIYGNRLHDTIEGGGGNDTIEGGGHSDVLYGDSGNDLIYGDTVESNSEGGNDSLFGGGGHDTLHGGEGDDLLYGSNSADNLYGDSGNDTFVFKFGDTGIDYIRDFVSGEDTIDITDLLFDYDPQTDSIGDFVLITTPANTNTAIQVDVDGTGTGAIFTKVVLIMGQTGYTLIDMIQDGDLTIPL